MSEHGFYYLHRETKELIYKRFDPAADNSPFVQKVWTVDMSDRADAWRVVLEGLALGVKVERAKELAQKWVLTYEDSIEFLARVKPTDLMRSGLEKFIDQILGMSHAEYWLRAEKSLKEKQGGSNGGHPSQS